MKKQLMVSALENGTVIDHIPCERTSDVVNLLKINDSATTTVIGMGLDSKKMGKKSVIKIANKFFTDDELNQLSVIVPNVSLCIIRDFEVVEKKQVNLPEVLCNVVRCANPKCITNNEPMGTLFKVIDKDRRIIKCHYCEKEQSLEQAQLKK